MADIIRSIPLQDLDGATAIELESDYTASFTLREVDADGTDIGATSFHLFDPDNQNDDVGGGAGTGPNPDGQGYTCELRDEPGGTLLATATVTQNGVRAVQKLTHNVSAQVTHSVTINYPDLRDESVAPVTLERKYEFKTLASDMTLPGHLLRIPGEAEQELELLVRAINGTLDYGDGHAHPDTEGCLELVAFINPLDANEMVLEARDGGVWANLVRCEDTGNTFDWEGSTADEPMTGGAGSRGLTLTFDHADLRNALAPDGHARLVHYDIMGLNAAGDPTKLRAGRAALYRSATVTT